MGERKMPRRGLFASVVCDIVGEFGVAYTAGPSGIDLGYSEQDRCRCRLEPGSGIGGRNRAWKLVRIGRDATPAVTTRAELRRFLREWMAGMSEPRGPQAYARLNHNRFGQHWIWANTGELADPSEDD